MFVTVFVTLVVTLLTKIALGTLAAIYFVGIIGLPIALGLYLAAMAPGLWLFSRIFCVLQSQGFRRITSAKVAAAGVTGLISVILMVVFWLIGDPAGPIVGTLILCGPSAVAAWGAGVFISTGKTTTP